MNKNMVITGGERNRVISFVLSILLIAGLFAAIPPGEVQASGDTGVKVTATDDVTISHAGIVNGTDETLYVNVLKANSATRNYEIHGVGEILGVSVSAIMPDSMTGISIERNPAHPNDPVWVLNTAGADFPDPADRHTPDNYTLTISAIDKNGNTAQMTVPVEVGYEPIVTGATELYINKDEQIARNVPYEIDVGSRPLVHDGLTLVFNYHYGPEVQGRFHFSTTGAISDGILAAELIIDPGLPIKPDGYFLQLTATNPFGDDTMTTDMSCHLLVYVGEAPSGIEGPQSFVLASDYAEYTAKYNSVGGTDPGEFSLIASPAVSQFVRIATDGTLTVKPGAPAGDYEFAVRAENNYGDVKESVSFSVGPKPQIDGQDTISLVEGYAAAQIPYTFTNAPSAVTIAGSSRLSIGNVGAADFGVLTIAPGLAEGSYTATITATNNYGAATKAATITVAAKPPESITTPESIVAPENIMASKLTTAIKHAVWTGKQIKPAISVTLGTVALKQDLDYTVSYGANKNIGMGTVKIKGKGAYRNEKTFRFKIVPKKVTLKKVTAGKKRIKITWTKSSAAQKITKYQVRYRIKGKAWKEKTPAASKASLTVKKLQKGKQYQVQIRAYRTVGGVKFYGEWSNAKMSKIIK